MRYADGRVMRLGDRVEFDNMVGTLRVIIDERLADDGFAMEEWTYLGSGLMLVSEEAGLMHYPADLIHRVSLISRKASD